MEENKTMEQEPEIQEEMCIRDRFMKKWKELLEVPDAFYNCNLSLDDTDFRIRE